MVPPSGHTAWLTSFTAGAMAFLAVFALALSLAAGRLADRWSDALERTATMRLSAPDDQIDRADQGGAGYAGHDPRHRLGPRADR